MEENIIVVDERDNIIGYGEKTEVHRTGALHRAFSVFLYRTGKDTGTELLIQKRAKNKYHSAGLWANTCCSHPRRGELLEAAVERRLMEEAGISCDVKEVFSFVYKHEFAEDLFEHEFDHVFLGEFNGEYVINEEEAEEFAWIEVSELQRELEENPDKYTCWFKIAAPRVVELLDKEYR